MHVKGLKLKKSVIRKADVESGELSVWRLDQLDPGSLTALSQKVPPPFNDKIDRLLAVRASAVRGLLGPEPGSRAFSVIDDTRIDLAGARDPQHAALAPCNGWDLGNPIIVDDLVNRLYMIFKDNRAWP